jgi:hypothetical protein
MNFGQHWRTPGVVEVRYAIELPRRFLGDLFAGWGPLRWDMTADAASKALDVAHIAYRSDWTRAYF